MTTYSERFRAEVERVMATVRRAQHHDRCVICRQPAQVYADGQRAMTCGSPACMLAWIPQAAPRNQRHFTATEYLHKDAVERPDSDDESEADA